MSRDILTVLITMLGAIRVSTPFMFVALGECLTEKSGRVNLGLEGTLVLGARVGDAASHHSGNPWVGVFAVGLAGAALGAMHGSIRGLPRVNDLDVGIAMMMFGVGVAFFLGKPYIQFGRNHRRHGSPQASTIARCIRGRRSGPGSLATSASLSATARRAQSSHSSSATMACFPRWRVNAPTMAPRIMIRPAGYTAPLRAAWRFTNQANSFQNLMATANVCMCGSDGDFNSMGEGMLVNFDGSILAE